MLPLPVKILILSNLSGLQDPQDLVIMGRCLWKFLLDLILFYSDLKGLIKKKLSLLEVLEVLEL